MFVTRDGTSRERGPSWDVCTTHRNFIRKHLDDGVRLTKVRQLLRRQGVLVSYATLHRFAVQELGFGRKGETMPVADCGPGEELQVDTGLMGYLEPDATGKRRRYRAWIFTAVLSRHRFVYPCFQETTETAIEACEAAWGFFGGIFRVAVPDNTKAIVITADPLHPRLNRTFLEYAQVRGFYIDPTRVRSPRDKARVERSVLTVREDCFGGERLSSIEDARCRLIRIVEDRSKRPDASYLEAVGGDRRAAKGYYYVIDSPRDTLHPEAMLETHRQRTIERIMAQQTVLVVQDTTDLNFSTRHHTEGLGLIGTNQTGAESLGLKLHSSLALTTEGLPLGVLRTDCFSPERKGEAGKQSVGRPIEDKKSFRWLEGYRDCVQVAKKTPKTRLLTVMDREGDIFELFLDAEPTRKRVGVLVRARHNRRGDGAAAAEKAKEYDADLVTEKLLEAHPG